MHCNIFGRKGKNEEEKERNDIVLRELTEESDFIPDGKSILKNAVIVELTEAIKVAIPTVLITLFLFGVAFGLCFVVGSSMEPNYQNGDLIVVARDSFFYDSYSHLEKGDVIVFHPVSGEKNVLYVKRVIATSGDHIVIDYDTGTVSVNGTVLDEPYIKEAMEAMYEPTDLIVPDGCIFVMGDNRNNSQDSRSEHIGCVSKEQLFGKELLHIPL